MGPNRHIRNQQERPSARQSWWVLLAVSLAMMALIFAHSAGTNHAGMSASRASQRNGVPVQAGLAPESRQRPAIQKALALPDEPLSLATSPTRQPVNGEVQSPSPPVATSTTTSVAPIVESYPGYLRYPDNIVSSYPVSGEGGNITASASWHEVASLDLSISCPSGEQSVVGTSAMSVSLVASSGSCTVLIREEAPSTEPITYDLTVTISPRA
jgi:hypothetical protein